MTGRESRLPLSATRRGCWCSAGLAKGRTLTSYHTIQDDVRNAGAKWVDKEVVRDGNWVSSRQPTDIPAFNREMIVAVRRTQSARRYSA